MSYPFKSQLIAQEEFDQRLHFWIVLFPTSNARNYRCFLVTATNFLVQDTKSSCCQFVFNYRESTNVHFSSSSFAEFQGNMVPLLLSQASPSVVLSFPFPRLSFPLVPQKLLIHRCSINLVMSSDHVRFDRLFPGFICPWQVSIETIYRSWFVASSVALPVSPPTIPTPFFDHRVSGIHVQKFKRWEGTFRKVNCGPRWYVLPFLSDWFYSIVHSFDSDANEKFGRMTLGRINFTRFRKRDVF